MPEEHDTVEGTATDISDAETVTEETVPSAIFITKEKDENGKITANVGVQGTGIEVTEVQTLLEMGVFNWRTKIGLK